MQERSISGLPPVHVQAGHQTHNLGMLYPEWESNPQPFDYGVMLQPTGPPSRGPNDFSAQPPTPAVHRGARTLLVAPLRSHHVSASPCSHPWAINQSPPLLEPLKKKYCLLKVKDQLKSNSFVAVNGLTLATRKV